MTISNSSDVRYYVNTVSRDHLQRGIEGGFTQANHGRITGLKRLLRGDLIVFYSPRTSFEGGEPLQSFTALARVTDDEPYQAQMTTTFHPWRRKVEFLSAESASIRPLLERLEFIVDKQRWGMPFRCGFFEVSRADFDVIARAMKASI